MLQVGDIDYKNYINLVEKGPVNNKELSETILKEKRLYAQRALRLTPDLFRRIPPEKLVRIPNALMHALRKYITQYNIQILQLTKLFAGISNTEH